MEQNKDFNGHDRRKFVRLNASVDVQYAVLENQSLRKKKVLSKNISAGGICIIAYEEIPLGTELALTIYFPNESSPILCKGKVVWSRPFQVGEEQKPQFDVGVGIEFFDINEKDKSKIDQSVFKYKK